MYVSRCFTSYSSLAVKDMLLYGTSAMGSLCVILEVGSLFIMSGLRSLRMLSQKVRFAALLSIMIMKSYMERKCTAFHAEYVLFIRLLQKVCIYSN